MTDPSRPGSRLDLRAVVLSIPTAAFFIIAGDRNDLSGLLPAVIGVALAGVTALIAGVLWGRWQVTAPSLAALPVVVCVVCATVLTDEASYFLTAAIVITLSYVFAALGTLLHDRNRPSNTN